MTKSLFKRRLLALSAFGLLLTSGCSSIRSDAPAKAPMDRSQHGMVWKFFNPEYAQDWPLAGKILFWVGPGH